MMPSHRVQAIAGATLLGLLVLPWTRHTLEASMWRHMLGQFPLCLISGALLIAALPPRTHAIVTRWNTHGATGLVAASVVLAVLMIPRVLDLALYRPDIEAAKLAALLLAGGALRISWRPAGLIVQSFFLGYLLATMAIVGMLYMETPLRLCNAYLLDDQKKLGQWLTVGAAAIGIAWLLWAGRRLVRVDAQQEQPSTRTAHCGSRKHDQPPVAISPGPLNSSH